MLKSLVLSRVDYANNIALHVPHGLSKETQGSLTDDTKRGIEVNFTLVRHKLSFLIGQLEVGV